MEENLKKTDFESELRDIHFIKLVQENPILYGKPSGLYDKSEKKSKIWHRIAGEMHFSVDQAVKKWRYLRDKYVKEKRKLNSARGYDSDNDKYDDNHDETNTEIRVWPLYDYLTFLNKHVRNRSNGTTISADTRRDMEFIRLVEENPILYNKTSVSYTNTHKRAAIWTKIALIMNFTEGDEAHKKWRYLRDKYVKHKRAIRYDSSISEDFEEWPLYKNLSFLSKHVRKRRAVNEYTTPNANMKTESNQYVTIDTVNHNNDNQIEQGQAENFNQELYVINELETSNTTINENVYYNNENDHYVIDHSVEYELELPPTEHHQHLIQQTVEEIVDELSSEHIISSDDPLIDYDELIDDSQELVDISSEVIAAETNKYDTHTTNSVNNVIQQQNLENSFINSSIDGKDAAFCAYVAHEMKEMSKKNKNLLKCMITNFINEKNSE